MTGATVVNRVRRGFYLDSVALMRISQAMQERSEVDAASLMIGTESNKELLDGADLLRDDGRKAGPSDLIVALRASSAGAAADALAEAEALLDRPKAATVEGDTWSPRSLDTVLEAVPEANLAIVSVPGAFATREARRAMRRGLNVMLFSDNVSVDDECALKREALERGLLMMGPDCGTALIGGVPLGFANVVPRGGIGLVSASGTGLQEVTSLIARGGGGVSHGIGVGGRDLTDRVGGAMTLAAIDALDADAGTERIVLISKPPGVAVARRVLERVAQSAKRFTVCYFGVADPELPTNATFAPTLRAAAEDALGGFTVGCRFDPTAVADRTGRSDPGRERIIGLFAGGTLCAEVQAVLIDAGEPVRSNAPIPGAVDADGGGTGHELLDLGADEFTRGRPHPMIEPAVRRDPIAKALADATVAVVLVDVVLGYGSHPDPADEIVNVVGRARQDRPPVVASVCGTEADPQHYSAQVDALEKAGIIVAPSNAHAAELALAITRRANR